MLLVMGQISGILFILGMDAFKNPDTGSMSSSLLVLAGLMVIGLLLSTRLTESTLLARESSGEELAAE
jgi:LPXTG-motif cell wall-anchored protein